MTEIGETTAASSVIRLVGLDSTDYDRAHAAAHERPLVRELWARPMGEQYPAEVDPFSSCSWWTLGQAIAGLCLSPGGLLVDLGCGRGGPGLWLARALSARLIGIDFSATAIELAGRRAADFGLANRVEFRHATLEHTTIDDQTADAIVSVDALPFATDRTAALCEARRILRPAAAWWSPAVRPDRTRTAGSPWPREPARTSTRRTPTMHTTNIGDGSTRCGGHTNLICGPKSAMW